MPRFPLTSQASAGISDLVYTALRDKVAAHKGVLHKLNVGDTYLDPPECARVENTLPLLGHDRAYNYSPNQGEPLLLDAIEKYLGGLGRSVSRANIQVTASGTTATNIILSALLDKDDEFILPTPYWPLMSGAIKLRGAKPVEVNIFNRLNEPSFSLEKALTDVITPRTVGVYINPVHNPTGRVLPLQMVDELARVVKKHDLWVLLDDAYEQLYYTPERPLPLWARDDFMERSVVMHTLSKMFAFCGGRIGFIHGPEHIMGAVRGLQTYYSYSAAHPLQLSAARALNEGGAFLERSRALYKEAAQMTAKALNVDCPEGGTFVFVDVKKYMKDGETLMNLLERCIDEGVLVAPGYISGDEFQHHIRVCFTAVPPTDLSDALVRLQRALGIQ